MTARSSGVTRTVIVSPRRRFSLPLDMSHPHPHAPPCVVVQGCSPLPGSDMYASETLPCARPKRPSGLGRDRLPPGRGGEPTFGARTARLRLHPPRWGSKGSVSALVVAGAEIPSLVSKGHEGPSVVVPRGAKAPWSSPGTNIPVMFPKSTKALWSRVQGRESPAQVSKGREGSLVGCTGRSSCARGCNGVCNDPLPSQPVVNDWRRAV